MKATNRSNLFFQYKDSFFLALLAISVIVNYLLIARIKFLENNFAYINEAGKLKVGDKVAPIELKNWLSGKQELVKFQINDKSQGTIFYFFSPRCGWCNRNLANIKELYTKTEPTYQFIGLTTDDKGLKEYVESNNINYPIHTPVDFNSFRAYDFGGTPQTLVISNNGEVLATWPGAYTDDNKKEIESFFKITLPGLIREAS